MRIRINKVMPDAWAIVVLLWHRHMIFPGWPIIRRVTGKRAQQLNDGVPGR
jgi:hypothetical protein